MKKLRVLLSMYIDPDLKRALIEMADRQNRSMANLIETALREWIAGASK